MYKLSTKFTYSKFFHILKYFKTKYSTKAQNWLQILTHALSPISFFFFIFIIIFCCKTSAPKFFFIYYYIKNLNSCTLTHWVTHTGVLVYREAVCLNESYEVDHLITNLQYYRAT